MKNRVLHIMIADQKFILPLLETMVGNDQFRNHHYLVFDNGIEINFIDKAVHVIKSPYRRNFLFKLFIYVRLILNSSKIVLHGLPMLNLLMFFPLKWKKISWMIHGADLYGRLQKDNRSIFEYLIIKSFKRHITHIEGDSKLANKVFNSNAEFHYSPMYLSNVVDLKEFNNVANKKNKFILLVGNSLSKNNNHIEVLSKLHKYRNQISKVICPLSYGNDFDYKNEVIAIGQSLYGEKFLPLTEFMTRSEYEKLLSRVDIAIFDHWRQEAMGVTLSLLSLGKTVYMKNSTESYKSLVSRGFKIFNNQLIFENGPKIYDINKNKELLKKYYSLEALKQSLLKL